MSNETEKMHHILKDDMLLVSVKNWKKTETFDKEILLFNLLGSLSRLLGRTFYIVFEFPNSKWKLKITIRK